MDRNYYDSIGFCFNMTAISGATAVNEAMVHLRSASGEFRRAARDYVNGDMPELASDCQTAAMEIDKLINALDN